MSLLERIHAVEEPIGEGGRDWYPYMIRPELRELGAGVPELAALLGEERDPSWREVLLFLLAAADDPRADDVLIEALDDPALRPRALYLLGAIGTRGWPKRDRDRDRLLRAILPWTEDHTSYRDPFLGEQVEVGDLAKAAFVRIAGPDEIAALRWLDEETARFIGMAVPTLSARDREHLDSEIRRYAAAL